MGIQMDCPEAIAVMPVRFGWMLKSLTNMLIVLRVHQAGWIPPLYRLDPGRYPMR